MSLEILKLLVLSTSHVTAATAAMLDVTDVENWPVSGGTHGAYGWFCYAHDENLEGKIPVEMMNVFRFAREQECDYVLFDRDADVVEELPVWEW